MKIFEEKIIYEAKDFVKEKLHFKFLGRVHDRIGTLGYLMRDGRGRIYLMVAKRYIYFQKDGTGLVSVNKKLLKKCLKHNWYLLMYIEAKDRRYIYSISPLVALKKKEFENFFNKQKMVNFDITRNGVNMIPTRTQNAILNKYIKMGIR